MRPILFSFLSITLLLSNVNCLAQSQPKVIEGKVIDENGEGIPRVAIQVKGTSQGTVTDMDGNFSIEAEKGAKLIISSVGFSTEEIKVGEDSTLYIMITEHGIQNTYWCCTSHNESPHCAKERDSLRENHPSDEQYKRKRLRQ